MNDSQRLVEAITKEIKAAWPVTAEPTIAQLDDRLKWDMNCAGFKPCMFDHPESANKILQVGPNEFFFLSITRYSIEMIDYWSPTFQFHHWYGHSKTLGELSSDEKAISDMCQKYRYIA